jgi:hypothetical protein
MAYPTADDLKDFIKSTGLTSDVSVAPYSYMDWEGAVEAAAEEFERSVGWFPFLSSGSASARTFDAPVPNYRDLPRLELQGGLVSLTSVTASGNTITTPNLVTKPDNATSRGLPITALAFWRVAFPPTPKCVTVTGVWGFCSTLPSAVSRAVTARAAQLLFAEVSMGVSGGIVRKKEGDEEWQYGNDDFKMAMEEYGRQFQEIVRRYKRG